MLWERSRTLAGIGGFIQPLCIYHFCKAILSPSPQELEFPHPLNQGHSYSSFWHQNEKWVSQLWLWSLRSHEYPNLSEFCNPQVTLAWWGEERAHRRESWYPSRGHLKSAYSHLASKHKREPADISTADQRQTQMTKYIWIHSSLDDKNYPLNHRAVNNNECIFFLSL